LSAATGLTGLAVREENPLPRVVALVTAHNRRETTLKAIDSLLQATASNRVDLSVVLVDDGSSDGTGQAVSDTFEKRVSVIRGDGSYYWARGMKVAEDAALEGAADFLLWLNDDVELFAGAVDQLLAVEDSDLCMGRGIVVGSMRSLSGETTYGGLHRLGRHPLRYSLVTPGDEPRLVDAANGNAVLIPVSVLGAIGGIDGGFAHALADIDFTRRARLSEVPVVIAAGYVGICERNPPPVWTRPDVSASQRWGALLGPKGLPPRSLARFLSRHGGPFWPIYFASPYLAQFLRSISFPGRRIRGHSKKRSQSSTGVRP
jgi:GT2 family glycosyltransferase